MKYAIIRFVALTGAIGFVNVPLASAGTPKRASAPIIITPPAVPDGSNYSRAPFPASRPQNDVTPPNGQAFDLNMAPNTPSTTPEPLPTPVPAVAIMQRRVAPGLEPTGRPTVAVTSSLDPAMTDATIRNSGFDSRDNLVDDIRLRLRNSMVTLAAINRTRSDMSTEGQGRFDALYGQLKSEKRTLDKSLRRAANASGADWEDARAQLLSDFDAYAATAAQVDSAIGIAPVR